MSDLHIFIYINAFAEEHGAARGAGSRERGEQLELVAEYKVASVNERKPALRRVKGSGGVKTMVK